ncbi:MHYT domain-containing protein [Planomonospora venezuelensis]|uniref:NO-binding membrane sensor protein with MHYT domain n=1 Tax=Planomonospora venezuelensis TaxID=1999 RepID=A0A841CZS6_PLAVE|nr:MHYT domain-containing protein [Planomonospora venezuelensis]MBB5961804.1 NO-binding membrane sensor protein with MHYT domain [Planomonospora venezuelensis]GIM99540.1 membrane protein [Planomonospora venezuelensis]
MSHVDHFSSGLLTPSLAYLVSSIGCMLGLMLTARARAATGAARARWLTGGALSIGGTGIWVMHFVAMMGFSVGGAQIRYDVPLTAGSAVLAIVVVGAGLFLVSRGDARTVPLLGGGLLTGLGVAGMHYLGMAAMNMSAHVSYDPVLVGASAAIAVAASTVALWFTMRVRGVAATGGAALIMGVAVCGMHYTGMFAMDVRPTVSLVPIEGARGIDFLLPLLALVSLISLGLLLAAILSPSEREMQVDAELMARLEEQQTGSFAAVPRTALPAPAAEPRRPSLFDAPER